jgi:plastocyanin
MMRRNPGLRAFGAALTLALVAAACGAGAVTTTTTTEATTTTGAAASATIEVRAVDYGFEGLPERVASGITLTLVNESDVELHEIVAFRLDDDETRSVAELLDDPASLMAYFPRVATVVIAPPLAMGFPVVGTGTLTEPGRYAIICAIPVGADPEEYLAAAAESEGGPPEVEGGPPHFVVGMFAEIIVED